MKRLVVAVAVVGILARMASAANDVYTNWAYYKTVTVTPRHAVSSTTATATGDSLCGSTAIANFPVLVRLNGAVGSGTQDSLVFLQSQVAGGKDIRFCATDGVTHYAYQIQFWNSTLRQAALWVLTTSIATSGATTFRMYWGNSAAGDSSPVFTPLVFATTNNFYGVYLLGDSTIATGVTDASGHNNGTSVGSMTVASNVVPGIIGNATYFNASTQYINCGTAANVGMSSATHAYSISGWINPRAFRQDGTVFSYGKSGGGTNGDIISFDLTSTGLAYSVHWGGRLYDSAYPSATLSANNWQFVSFMGIGGSSSPKESCFVNGVYKGSRTYNAQALPSTGSEWIGAAVWNNVLVDSTSINEVRVESVARSSNWMKLEYETQAANQTVVTQGTLTPQFAPSLTGYTINPDTAMIGVPITNSGPVFTGWVSPGGFSISPPLPTGLSINSTTGVISGTASGSAAPQAGYTITATNAAGTSTTTLNIAVANPPYAPAMPTLTSPSTGTTQPISLTLSWGSVLYAGTYELQVSTDPAFGSTVIDNATLTSPSMAVSLSGNTTYYWRVNAANSNGPSAWTSAWSFLTVPAAPTLNSPTGGAVVSLAPALTWGSVFGAQNYHVQVSTSNTFSPMFLEDSSMTAPTKQLSGLSPAITYYWRVQAKNAAGAVGLYSSAASFAAIGTPTLSLPVNTQVEISTSAPLTWNTVANATEYWVQISTDVNFIASPAVNDSTPTTGSVTEGGLSPGITYYWRVAATAGGGWGFGGWSGVWSFYTTENYASGWSGTKVIGFNTRGALTGGGNAGANVSATQYKFPVLVRLAAIDVQAMSGVQPNGSDIRFTNANGVHLPFQIDTFNVNNGASIWVLADSVTGSAANQSIKMLWGNSSALTSISRGFTVFDTGNGFAGVWHLGNSYTDSVRDQTINRFNGTQTGMTASGVVPGLIGACDSFNGTTGQYIKVPPAAGGASPYGSGGKDFTLAGWMKTSTAAPSGTNWYNGAALFDGEMPGFVNDYGIAYLSNTASNSLAFGTGDNGTDQALFGTGTALNDGNWHYIVGTRVYSSGAKVLYIDGVQNGTQTGAASIAENIPTGYWIGHNPDEGGSFNGCIDEVHVSKVARSAPWVALSYQNQKPSQTLVYTTAPLSVAYRNSALAFTMETQFTLADTPVTVSGVVTQYSVSPSLPLGLSLDPVQGIISGTATPTAAQNATPYTITASNAVGSLNTIITISVANIDGSTTILSQPANLTVPENTTAKFGLTVSGTPPFEYQWIGSSGTVRDTASDNALNDTLRINSGVGAANDASWYYCQVINGSGTVSTTTDTLYVAAAPALVSPGNNALGVAASSTLSWNSVTSGNMYYLQLSTSSAFSPVALTDSSVMLSKAEALSPGTVYYWRVQSKRNGVLSLWSNSSSGPWQFTTLPAAPVLSLPVNTAVEVATSPTLSWGSVAGTINYDVQIATDSLFSNVVVNDATPTTASAAESGLSNGTTYYWRVAASNGAYGPWSSPTWKFYTTENYGAWTGSKVIAFNNRGAVTGGGAAGTGVTTTQYKFPVLVRLSYGDLSAMNSQAALQPNGSDIRFTNASGAHLPFEIDTFYFQPGNTGSQGAIWVLADSVTGNSANQYIRMLWGNSGGVPSISKGSMVFDTANGFVGVWHLNNATFANSTINSFTMAGSTASYCDTAGMIGEGRKFKIPNMDTIRASGLMGSPATVTLSTWAKVDSVNLNNSQNAGEMISIGDCAILRAVESYSSLRDSINGGWRYSTAWGNFMNPGAAGENLHQGWKHYVYVCDPSNSVNKIYINGVPQTLTAQGSPAQSPTYALSYSGQGANTYFGHHGNGMTTYCFGGILDEPRIEKVDRPADWEKLCFQNQQANQTLTYTTAPTSVTYKSTTLNLTTTAAMALDTPATVTGIVSQYSVSPPLPSGLSLNSATGGISGTPSAAAGATAYVITASNPIGSVTAGVTISVIAPPSGLAYATNPATYLLNAPIANDSVSVTNPVDSFTVSGALPAGLSLNKTTGTITGTPTATQSAAAYTITAKNIAGSATVVLTITVIAATPPSGLSYSTPSASYWQNVAVIADTATLAAGIADSFTAFPALPSGLSLNKTTGAISGTPGATQASSAYTVTAKNAAGVATASITILVYGPPLALAYALNPAVFWLGVAIATDSATLTGVADSFSVSPALPSGLSLNTATGSITGTPGATQASSAYAVSAWNPAGSASVSLLITINGPPSVPVLALPVDNANTVTSTPRLSWNTAALALSYHVQLSTSASFTPLVADSSLGGASDSIVAKLPGGVQYYWRVAATNPAGSSAWTTDSFTVMVYIAVPVRAGWNFVSLNVHAQDSLAADVMGTLKGFILAKTLTQVYWPYYGIDGIDTLAVVRGYQMFCDSVDTIKAAGPAVNVSATPIPLYGGWNLISYLPQAPMSVDSALAAVDSQVVLVKNQDGYVYWPAEELDGIGNMVSGQGYQMYMSISTVLTYPAGAGHARRFAGVVRKSAALPRPKHFACALNTGSSATVLSKRTTINGATARDSCEIGVYDGKGNLVGSGVVVHGATAFSVWGKSGLKKGTAAGCDASEKLTFKLWDGAQEYPLEFHGTMQPQYADNAILSGTLVVPSSLFITKFALMDAYPNPFRSNIRIAFDVPAVAGKELQEVRINVYDVRGSVVARLAVGKFRAGHYSVSWNGGDASALGSNMYIVEMKAPNFDKLMKLYRVK